MFQNILQGISGGNQSDVIEIQKVANGFTVEIPRPNGDIGDIIEGAMQTQEKMIDPVMSKINRDKENELSKDKIRVDYGIYVFREFKEVIAFLNYYFYKGETN